MLISPATWLIYSQADGEDGVWTGPISGWLGWIRR